MNEFSHPSSVIRHPSFVIRHPSFVIRHPSSVIRHPSSVIRHPSSVIRHPSSVIRHSSSVIRHPSSVIRHPSSVIRHPSFVIRHSSFVISSIRATGPKAFPQESPDGPALSDQRSVAPAQPVALGLPRHGADEPGGDDRDGPGDRSTPSPRQDAQDGRGGADGRARGHPQAQVRHDRRGRDGRAGGRDGRAAGLSDHRPQRRATRPLDPRLPRDVVPRGRRPPRPGPGPLGRAGGDRQAPSGADRPGGRMGRTGIDPGAPAEDLAALVGTPAEPRAGRAARL